MSEERCDVAVIGAGLVGVALAYELACLGASVAVIDAGHPGRATDAGAGILSPVTSMETEEPMWLFLREAGAHYPALLLRMEFDGVGVAGTGYGLCGMLSVGLRPNEDEWFDPFAELVLRRAPGEIAEITPEEASSHFPPLGPVHRVLPPRPVRRGSTAGAWPPRSARPRRHAASCSCPVLRTASGRAASPRGPGADAASRPSRSRGIRTCSATRLPSPVAPGPRRPASGSAQDCPSVPRRGRSCISASVRRRAGGRSCSRCSPTISCPGPGGGWPAAARSRAAAGFSVGVTAAGLHELLPRVPDGGAGTERRHLPRARVGLRPTSADDRAVVGRLPGWGNAWVATGHGANGLLQGPYSARVLAHEMAGVAQPADEAPLPGSFDPGRFA